MEEYLRDHLFSVGLAVGGALSVGFGIYRYRKWVGGGVCRSRASMRGKTAVITGANTGIGLEAAVDLARRGARVVLACRDVCRGEKAATEVQRRSGGNGDLTVVHLDLSSLDSVREAAATLLRAEPRIDVLINNAGVALTRHAKTRDGFEMHFGVNHLGHFLLTNLLLPRLRENPSGTRVVTVSSSLYKRSRSFDFDEVGSSDPRRYAPNMPGRAYSQSKLANVLFSRSLARRLEGSKVCAYVMCPGIIFRTALTRDFYPRFNVFVRIMFQIIGLLFLKTPQQGAQTTIYCAVSEELEGVSGRFYRECREMELATDVAKDDDVAERLWRMSAKMVGLDSSPQQ